MEPKTGVKELKKDNNNFILADNKIKNQVGKNLKLLKAKSSKQ